jgi:hypothetical protein
LEKQENAPRAESDWRPGKRVGCKQAAWPVVVASQSGCARLSGRLTLGCATTMGCVCMQAREGTLGHMTTGPHGNNKKRKQ